MSFIQGKGKVDDINMHEIPTAAGKRPASGTSTDTDGSDDKKKKEKPPQVGVVELVRQQNHY